MTKWEICVNKKAKKKIGVAKLGKERDICGLQRERSVVHRVHQAEIAALLCIPKILKK
jgi:hypothetical protein